MSSTLLEPGKTTTEHMRLQLNMISTEDEVLKLGYTEGSEFFRISDVLTQKRFSTSHSNHNLVFNAPIMLASQGIEHSRVKYDLLACFGDVGGLYAFILPLFAFFLNPMSEHSFFLTAASELFYARHVDGKCNDGECLFEKNCNCNPKVKLFLNSTLLSK